MKRNKFIVGAIAVIALLILICIPFIDSVPEGTAKTIGLIITIPILILWSWFSGLIPLIIHLIKKLFKK